MKSIRKFLCTLLTSALLLGITSYGVPALQVNAVEFNSVTIPVFNDDGEEPHDAGPTPDGGNNYQLTYSVIDLDEVEAYEQKLLTAGFKEYDKREIKNGNKTNLFATYVNGDVMVHINYFPALTDNQLHVIYGSKKYLLPTTEADDYDAVVTPSVAIINATDTVLCMVIQLADGSYVIIDGGYSTYTNDGGRVRIVPEDENRTTGAPQETITTNYKEDHDTLLAYLRDTNRDGDINEKDTTPQVIWMATHADADHIGLPITFLSDNLDSYNYHQYINLTAVIYNFPEFTNIGLTGDGAENLNLRVSRFIEAASTSFPNAPHYIYHTGQVLNLPGCQIEFLYTPEDYYPNKMDNANYTCGMWRFVFDGGKSLLITGDSETKTTTQAYNVLGSYLKSDMLQVIHHGANGGTEAFNNAVDPSVCFWPCPDILFKYDTRMLGTKSGYDFNKTLRDGDRIHYANSETRTVYIPTLTYHANGGTGTMDSETGLYCSQTANLGTSPTFSTTLSANAFTGPDNQNFLGWSTSPGGDVVYASEDIVNVTSSMELYAVWKEKVTFESVGHNVRLQDLIKIGYYFKVTANVDIAEVGTLLWTEEDYKNETDFTLTSTRAKKATITVSNGVYTAETDGIYAQYLDTVYYAIPYVKTATGDYFYGSADTYSVLDYAEWALASDKESLKILIINLLNYATAARTYFGYTEGIAAPEKAFNSILSDEEKKLDWNDSLKRTDPTVSEKVGVGGQYELEEIPDASAEIFDAQYIGRNVNLLDAISIGVYYDNTSVQGAYYWTESAYNAANIHNQYTASGDATLTRYETYVKLSIPKIYSFNIYDNYYIRAYNSEGKLGATKGLSVAAYLSWVVDTYGSKEDDESQALTELAKAMLIYGNYAETYFANQ